MASTVGVYVVDAVKSFVIMELWTEKKMYAMMILKIMITFLKNSFDDKLNKFFLADYRERSRNFFTSMMELVLTIIKGWKPLTIVLKSYILGMAKFLGLSCRSCHVAILFIGDWY